MPDIYENPNTHRVLLVEVDAYNVVSATSETFYFGSDFFITEPGDVPANTIYSGVLQGDVSFSKELFNGDKLRGKGIPDRGAFTIFNTLEPGRNAARYDDLINPDKYTFDGRACRIYAIEKGAAYSSKVLLQRCSIDDIEYDESSITFRLRGNAYLLNNQIQSSRYAGTGDAEGGADLKDLPKPLTFGRLRNVPGTLINSSYLVYQFHDGAVQEFEAVRVRGVDITFSADYSNYAALVAATISAGEYATCKALGLIRFNTTPDGEVTADIKGSTLSGTYSAKTGDIMSYIVSNYSDWTDIDTASITALNTANGGDVGVYVGTREQSIDSVLDELANSIGAFYSGNRDGKFSVGRVTTPSIISSVDIDESDIENNSLKRSTIGRPIWKATLGYKPAIVVQSPDSLAGSVTPDNRQLFSQDYLTETASDSSVKTKHTGAVDFRFNSNLYDASAASTEVSRILTLFKSRRDIFTAQTNLKPLQVELGDTISITHSRYNLQSGKNFVIMGYTEYYLSGRVEIKAFG